MITIIFLIVLAIATISGFYIWDRSTLDENIYQYRCRLINLKLASHLNPIIKCDFRVAKSSNKAIDDLLSFDNITPKQKELIEALRQSDDTIKSMESIYQNSNSIIKSDLDPLQCEVLFHLKKTPKFMKYQRNQLQELDDDISKLIDELNKEEK